MSLLQCTCAGLIRKTLQTALCSFLLSLRGCLRSSFRWMCFNFFCFSDVTSLLVRLFISSLIHKNPESWTKSRLPTRSSCYCNSELPVHFDEARFSEINRRPPSQGNTHIAPLTSKGRLCFSVLCKPVLIRYTWPSGTEAQLWLIETTNKELSLSPRSLRNRLTPGKGREQK